MPGFSNAFCFSLYRMEYLSSFMSACFPKVMYYSPPVSDLSNWEDDARRLRSRLISLDDSPADPVSLTNARDGSEPIMNVQYRVLLLVVLVLVFFDLLMLNSEQEFRKNLATLAKYEKNRQERAVELLFVHQKREFLHYLEDYAEWDDLAAFIANPNPTWAREDLDPGLAIYDLDALILYDTQGRCVYSLERSPEYRTLRSSFQPDELNRLFRNHTAFFFERHAQSPVFVGGGPVRVSHGHAPGTTFHGYCVIARGLTTGFLSRWSEESGLGIEIVTHPPSTASQTAPRVARPLLDDMNQTVAWAVFRDNGSVQLALMRVERRESIIFLGAMLIMVLVLYFTMQRWIARPLNRITRKLKSAGIEIPPRDPGYRNDLGFIEAGIDALQTRQNALSVELGAKLREIDRLSITERMGEEILLRLPRPLFQTDSTCRIIRANDEFARVAGQSQASLAGRHIDEVFPNIPTLENLIQEGRNGVVSREIDYDSGEGRATAQITCIPTLTGDGETGVFGILRDITGERLQARENAYVAKCLKGAGAIARPILSATDWRSESESILRYMGEFIETGGISLYLCEQTTPEQIDFHLESIWKGLDFPIDSNLPLAFSITHPDWLNSLMSGNPVRVQGAIAIARMRIFMEPYKSGRVVFFPILCANRLIGALCRTDSRSERSGPEDELLRLTADLIGGVDQLQHTRSVLSQQIRSLSRMVDFYPQPVALVDIEGPVRMFNSRFTETFGFDRMELPDLPDLIRWLTEFREQPENAAASLSVQLHQITADGGLMAIPVNGVHTGSGSVLQVETWVFPAVRHFLFIFNDRTEDHQWAAAFQRKQEEFRRIIENIGDDVLILNHLDHTLAVGPAFAERYGVRIGSVPDFSSFDIVEPRGERLTDKLRQARETGEITSFDIHRLKSPDSGIRTFSGRVIPLRPHPEAGALIVLHDLTEQMIHDAEHLPTRDVFLQLFEEIQAPCGILRPEGDTFGIVVMNRTARMLTEVQDMTLVDGLVARTLANNPGLLAAMKRCANTGELVREDYKSNRGPSDRPAYLQLCLSLLPDGDILAQAVDVSGLAGAVEAAEESERRYQGLLDSMNQGVIMTDAQNRIIFVNPPLRILTGYSNDEIIGRSLYEFMDSYNQMLTLEYYRARKNDENPPFHLELVCKNGSRITVSVGVKILRNQDGAYQGMIASLTDITELVRATASLKRVDARLSAILDGIPHAIHIRNAKGEIILANRAFRDINGLTGEFPPGLSLRDLMPDAAAEEEIADDHAAFATGQGKMLPEHLWIDRNGMYHWLEVDKTPFIDQGEPVMLVVSYDISNRRFNQDALQKRVEIEQLLSAVTSDIVSYSGQQLSEQIRSALTRIAEFFRVDCGIFYFNFPDDSQHRTIESAIGDSDLVDAFTTRLPKGFRNRLAGGGAIVWPSLPDMDQSHDNLTRQVEMIAGSGFILPLRLTRDPVGWFGLMVREPQRLWTPEDAHLLSLIGDIFTHWADRMRLHSLAETSEQNYRMLFENSGDMIMMIRFPEGVVSEINHRTREVLGYTIDDFKQLPAYGFLSGERRETTRTSCREQLMKGDSFFVETEAIARDGHVVPLEISGIRLPQDSYSLIVVIARDITTRKETDALLKDSEAKFRRLIESAPTGIFYTDPGGNYLYVNRRWLDQTGMTILDALGDGWLGIIDETERKAVAASWRKAVRKKAPWSREFQLTRRSGANSRAVAIATPMPDSSGKNTGYIGVLLDQTIQFLTLEELNESRDNLSIILDSNPQGMLLTDPGLRIICYNQVLNRWSESYLGMPLENNRELADYTIEDDAGARIWEKILLAQQGMTSDEEQMVADHWFRLIIAPIQNSAGKPYRICITVEDVTQKHLLDKKMLDSLKEKEALLQEIHHRVKNNLQLIASLLSLQIACVGNEETRRILNDNLGRIYSIAMIHQKLYESESIAHIEMQPYLEDLVRHMQTIYRTGILRPDIHVSAEQVWLPVSQAVPCGLIINELTVNAVKHAFPGRNVGRIDIRLLSFPGAIRLEVRDDGVGLPENAEPDSRHLGLQLVELMTNQLQGSFQTVSDHGAVCTITFSPSGDSQ
jgi:PAS domain S-box-containing protein